MKTWVLGLCVVLVMGACQGGPAEFENAQAVADAMEDQGIECEDLETTTEFANEEDEVVSERGLCRVDGATVVISMFETTEDRDAWIAAADVYGEVAAGENWVISAASQDVIQDVVASLDATIPQED